MSASPLIEIHGDVWLIADIICISLDQPEEGKPWEISIRLRNDIGEEWEFYEMDSEEEAKDKHIAMVAAWEKWLTS